MAIPPSPTAHRTERFQALLVDSSPELNQLRRSLFSESEWDVAIAADNKQALEMAKARPFDLIITGERSTSQEDIELLGRLRLVRPHTRLIILTEEFVPGDVLASIQARAFSYFSRPFSTDKLAEIIRIAMEEPFWDDGIEILSATPN